MFRTLLIRIAIAIICSVCLTSCNSHVHENTFPESGEETFMASEKAQEPSFGNTLIAGEIIEYVGGNSKQYLTDAKYIIDSDIFDKELNKLYEMGNIETPPISVPEKENSETVEFNMRRIPDDIRSNIPQLCSGLFFFMGEVKEAEEYKYHLFSYDAEEGIIIDTFSPVYEGMIYVDVVAGTDTLYILESDCDYSEKNPEWVIYSMDSKGEDIVEIDNSDNYDQTAMLPMMYAYKNKMSYVVGEKRGDVINHFVQLYENEVNKIIFNICNVKSPYVAARIDDEAIYYPEYFSDGWYLLKYNLINETITKYELPFLTEGEYPNLFVMSNEQIIYCSGTFGILYVVDSITGEFHTIARHGGGVGKGDLYDDKYFYRYNNSIWIYDLRERCRYLYKDLSSYETYTVCNGIITSNGKLIFGIKGVHRYFVEY